VGVTRDITKRKCHEAELVRALEDAREADRIKTRFLANMSHELRTPLNAVIGFSDILAGAAPGARKTGDQAARDQEYARIINASGRKLLDLVNGILDLARLQDGTYELDLQPLDIAELVDDCLRTHAGAADEASLTLRGELRGQLPRLAADEGACRQILHNLMSNAIKFTEPGGTVTVDARVSGETLSLIVADTGRGMSREDVENLCSLFTQHDDSYNRQHEGIGLGLSIVHKLARLHGGEVNIDSEPGVGTTVTVALLGRQISAAPRREPALLKNSA
jgi:cell cycle sensor histidine kinase DivJ